MNPSPTISVQTPRVAAVAIAGMALLILVALYHHPVLEPARDARDAQAQIVQFAVSDRLVHGALMAILVVLASALSIFGATLGARRPALSGAIATYCLGCVLLGVAMLLDGFITPELARRFVSAPTSETELGLLIMRSVGVAIQVFSKAGVVAQCAAILLWSYAAVTQCRQSPALRGFAGLGVLAGALPAAVILASDLQLAPHNLMAIFAAHVVWYLAAAWLLYRSGTASMSSSVMSP